jgi:hypothetical protein
MVLPKPAVTTATEDDMATESSVSAPTMDEDGSDKSDNLSEPNVLIQEDLQSLIAGKQKTFYDLQKKSEKMTLDLKIERQKNKQLEKDRLTFISSYKKNTKHTVDALTIAIDHHKSNAKSQEKAKVECLKGKDLKIKDLNGQLQKNMKDCKKMVATIDDLRRTVNRQVHNLSSIKGDLMSKMRECDIYKKENRSLVSQVSALHKKSVVYDERKYQHAIQLKEIELKTESIKNGRYEQTKVLKERTNKLEHERKLETIEFTARTRQSGKAKDIKRKQQAKLKKYQGGTDNMGVLHGELRKQNTVNGGCVPNPGRTSMTEVSFYFLLCLFYCIY